MAATKSVTRKPNPKAPPKAPVRAAKAPARRPAVKAPAHSRSRQPAPPAAVAPAAGSASKQAQLIALLRSPSGATLPQMTQLTGWQPHTVRGTISGVLRKRLGLTVACSLSEAGVRTYRIEAA